MILCMCVMKIQKENRSVAAHSMHMIRACCAYVCLLSAYNVLNI